MAEIKSHIGTQNKKGQTYTDAWEMMHEAPRNPSFYTGSEVIKEALRRASCDVMIAYPITPQSEAAALIGELFAEGYIGDYFRGESEFAVMSQCAGAAFGGARVFTTTAGPGTMRAMENFPQRLHGIGRAGSAFTSGAMLRRLLRDPYERRREPHSSRYVPTTLRSLPLTRALHGHGVSAGQNDA